MNLLIIEQFIMKNKNFIATNIFIICIILAIYGAALLIKNADKKCRLSTKNEQDYRYCIGI